MVFVPTQAPALEEHDAQELAKWAETELQRLSLSLQENEGVPANELHVAPAKPREGQSVFVDGTDWNPGSGRGPYMYVNGAWTFTGYVAPQDLSPYLTKADNLASLVDKTVSRSNLVVYSTTEVDTAVGLRLLKSSNLSDVANAATARGNLSAAAKTQKGVWTFGAVLSGNPTVDLVGYCPFAGTIDRMTAKMGAGTQTFVLSINGAPVTGATINATTVRQSVVPSGANTFIVGDSVELALSAGAGVSGLNVTVEYTRIFD